MSGCFEHKYTRGTRQWAVLGCALTLILTPSPIAQCPSRPPGVPPRRYDQVPGWGWDDAKKMRQLEAVGGAPGLPAAICLACT